MMIAREALGALILWPSQAIPVALAKMTQAVLACLIPAVLAMMRAIVAACLTRAEALILAALWVVAMIFLKREERFKNNHRNTLST